MKSTYDKTADAMYITLNKGKVVRTVQLTDRMNADMDKAGKVLGVEILNASQQLGSKTLSQISSIPVSVLNGVN